MPRRTTHLITCGLVLTHLVLLPATGALACSTFVLEDQGALLVGHNLDETPGFHVPGLVCINKRAVRKTGISWAELVAPPGERGTVEHPIPRLEWVSVFGSVTFNSEGLEFPDGGMNEAGLVVNEMSLKSTSFGTEAGRPTLFMSQWIQHVLDTCATVQEVIASARAVNLDGWSWHFLVADASGAAAAIEFIDGRVVIHTGKALPAPVLCNAPYAFELQRLWEHESAGALGALKELFSPPPRFVHAARMLEELGSSRDMAPVDAAWAILEEIRIRRWNKWSVLFDVHNRTVSFNTEGDREIRRLSFDGIDFGCETPARVLDVHSSRPGDISLAFSDFTREHHAAFVRRRADLLFEERLRPLTDSGLTVELYAERLSRYPEQTSCQMPR